MYTYFYMSNHTFLCFKRDFKNLRKSHIALADNIET